MLRGGRTPERKNASAKIIKLLHFKLIHSAIHSYLHEISRLSFYDLSEETYGWFVGVTG